MDPVILLKLRLQFYFVITTEFDNTLLMKLISSESEILRRTFYNPSFIIFHLILS